MHGEHKIFNIFRDYINKGILRLLGCKTNNITLGSLVNFGFNYGTGWLLDFTALLVNQR